MTSARRDSDEQELEDVASWDWDNAETREPVKSRRAVVTVNYPREDFERVAAAAQASGMKLSEYIRQASLRHTMTTGAVRVAAEITDDRGGFRPARGTTGNPIRPTVTITTNAHKEHVSAN